MRIFLIVFCTGLISCMVMLSAVLANYEKRAVEVRMSEMQTQLRILANHLITYNYLQDPSSDVIHSELNLLANLYDGRVLVINDRLRVVTDTYGMREGKTIISEEVVRCLRKGNAGISSAYDPADGYIMLTTPIIETASLEEGDALDATGQQEVVRGVMLTSVSTGSIGTTLDILSNKGLRIELIMILIVFAFALIAANVLLKPFDRITSAITEVRDGFSNEPISVPDYLETEHIVNAFNQVQERMRAMDASRQEFVSNVSHELKTPITSMKVLADTLLAQEDVPAETYHEFMTDISEEINREDEIINDLLSLVRMETQTTLNISSVNVNEMTEIVLKRLRPIARKRNVELTLNSEREIRAEIDEVKLSMVIMNLVENAVKYNKEYGWVKVTLDADHQCFTVTVEDSGIGMPEELIPHIYERFYRGDKSRSKEIGGTGLGLSIVRNAVQLHRGTIQVSSTPGEGTVFTVRIPLIYTIREDDRRNDAATEEM